MNPRIVSLLVLTLGGGSAIARADGSSDGRFGIVVFAGDNADMPGSFHEQSVPITSLDPTGTLAYHDLKFRDAYDDRYTAGLEFDYALSPSLTAFGRYAYDQFNGQEAPVGTFTADSGESVPVSARFSDTATQEYDVGGRYNFGPFSNVTPFVGLALGAEHLGATRAEYHNVSDTGTTNVTLGEADTVFHQRIETGVQFAPAPGFALRLSLAANHVDADTRSNDPNLAMVGLDTTTADVHSHWDFPVEVGGVWKF